MRTVLWRPVAAGSTRVPVGEVDVVPDQLVERALQSGRPLAQRQGLPDHLLHRAGVEDDEALQRVLCALEPRDPGAGIAGQGRVGEPVRGLADVRPDLFRRTAVAEPQATVAAVARQRPMSAAAVHASSVTSMWV